MNFFNLLKRVSNLKWSTDDPEPKTFDDVLMTSKIAMQQALLQLWHTYPFAFKKITRYQVLPALENTIEAPLGRLRAIVSETGRSLKYVETDDVFQKDVWGLPEYYRIVSDNSGDKIEFYPTPNEPVTIGIYYDTSCMAKDKNGHEKINLVSETDTVNITGPIQRELFENALILLTQVNLIQDLNDENFMPYQKAYTDALNLLIAYTTKPIGKRVVI